MLLIATAALLLQNSGNVLLRFTFFKFALPLPVLILIAVGIGIILGFWLDRPKKNAK